MNRHSPAERITARFAYAVMALTVLIFTAQFIRWGFFQ